MKISILLPYKENFAINYAGAVSIFVRDIVKNSKYFNTTNIFGSMKYEKPFLKQYINLSLKRSFYQSTSNEYLKSFFKIHYK